MLKATLQVNVYLLARAVLEGAVGSEIGIISESRTHLNKWKT